MKSHSEAQEFCQLSGAKLYEPKSNEELNYVISEAGLPVGTDWYLIGIDDIAMENK